MSIDTTVYKTRLEEMLKNLEHDLSGIGIHNPQNPSDWIATPENNGNDEADSDLVADRVEDWDERRALVATLETQYNNVVAALGRIEAGTYGICEISGKPIEPERLDASPTARTCKEHREDEAELP